MIKIQETTIALLLVSFCPSRSDATTIICEAERSSQSTMQLVVRLPEARHDEFVQLIKSADVVPVAKRLKYTGGGESSRSVYWFLNNSDYTVGVYADYFGQSKEFVFWVQTCNTTETWRPYWRALTTRIRAFPEAKVEERAYPKN